jgi:hypothetical protein
MLFRQLEDKEHNPFYGVAPLLKVAWRLGGLAGPIDKATVVVSDFEIESFTHPLPRLVDVQG